MIATAVLRSEHRRRYMAEISAMAPKLAGTLGTSGVSAALGMVSGTIAARVLGPGSRGDLAMLLLWPQLIVTVGVLGVELAATYYSADERRRGRVPATALTIAAVQAAVLVPLYLAIVPFLYRTTDLMGEAVIMAALIPLYLLGAMCIDCLAGTLRFGAFNAVRITLPVLYSGAVVLLAVAGSLTPSTGAYVYLGAHAAGDVLALALVWRLQGLGRFDGRLAKDMIGFGLRAHFGRMIPQSLGMDAAVIALALPARELGMYVAASAFLAAPALVASSVGMVIFPQVSATHQAGGRPRLQATFAVYVLTVSALSAMLFIAAPQIIELFFGSRYADAAPALRLLSIASVMLALRSFPVEVLRGVGRPGLTTLAEVANWTLFVALVPAGAALGGLAGTAAAVAIASTLSLGVLVAIIARAGLLGAARRQVLLSAEVG